MSNQGEGGATVFLVADNEVVRRGITELLEAERDLHVVGDAGTVEEALRSMPLVRPRVAVLDVRLPDGNGVELCRDLRALLPDLACLMLTSFTDDDALLDAVLAGAAGYVLKDIRGSRLVGKVRAAAAGGCLLDGHATSLIRQRLCAPGSNDFLSRLSVKEREVLAHIGEGLSNREISATMSLAEKTLNRYVANVLAELGLRRRTQVAVHVIELRQTVGERSADGRSRRPGDGYLPRQSRAGEPSDVQGQLHSAAHPGANPLAGSSTRGRRPRA